MKLIFLFLAASFLSCGRSGTSNSLLVNSERKKSADQTNAENSATNTTSQSAGFSPQNEIGDTSSGCVHHCSSTQALEIRRFEELPNSVLLRRAEPIPVLLGPDALEEIYARVFGRDPRRNGVFFNTAEADKLGGYRIISPSRASGGNTPLNSNMVPVEKLSFDYLFILREFTGAACRNLVEMEFRDMSAADNLLVEGRTPSAQKINSFLSALLGYEKQMHFGVEKYHAAFISLSQSPGAIVTTDQRNERIKDVYTHLCVALATDVRVYTR